MSDELTVVVGLGKTGLSCVRHLVGQEKTVAVTDTRVIPPCIQELRSEFPQVPVYLDGIYENVLDKASEIVVSPGICVREPAIAKQQARGVNAIGDIELFVQAAKAPIIAITGSNGKSTVTTLVGEMAKAAGKKIVVGGNLGTPALELLDDDAELYVLELSSFQLETTRSLQAAAATVLNITPDHLDRYESYDDYIAAKLSIYKNSKAQIINRDDSQTFINNPTISFGASEPNENEFGLRKVDGELFLAFGKNNLLNVKELKVKGQHQYLNALAAMALGHCVNLPMDAMLKALKAFTGLRHRCQWVADIEGVAWYNDSKATNVGATLAALHGLGAEIPGKIVLLAGGLAKDADFSSLREGAKQYVSRLILFGQDKKELKKVLEDVLDIQEVEDLQEAVKSAKSIATAGDIVLLSPACASFDMFSDFEARGDEFCNLICHLSSTMSS